MINAFAVRSAEPHPAPRPCSPEDALRSCVRRAASVVALVLLAGFAGQLAAAARLESLASGAYPALVDARALQATLADIRTELADREHDGVRTLRVDSLADRFHLLARRAALSSPSSEALDATFSTFLAAARRVQGAGTLDALVTEGPRDDRAYAQLAGLLARHVTSAERVVEVDLAAASRLQWLVGAAMALAGTVALALLALLGTLALRSVTQWDADLARRLDAVALGDAAVVGGRIETRVDDALRRLTRQVRDHGDAADALARGAFDRAARASRRRDRVSIALAALTTTMHERATSAARMARGNPAVALASDPVSDPLSRAHSAIAERMVVTCRDADTLRRGIQGLVVAARDDVAALASSAGVDAERLRRTEEQLAVVTLQARADAVRGEALTRGERAAGHTDVTTRARTDEDGPSLLAREVGALWRRQARSLNAIDDTVGHVQRTTARRADTARQVLTRLDALTSLARQLNGVLRRLDGGQADVLGAPPSVTGGVC